MTDQNPELQAQLVSIVSKCACLDARLKTLEDRIGVLEDVTISHETRLQEIEEEADADPE